MIKHSSKGRTAVSLQVSASMLAILCCFATQAYAQTVETVVVHGRTSPKEQPGGGLLSVETDPRAMQTLSEDFIAKQTPTANAQQMLNLLPSANVQDADPFGLQSGQSYIRGLDSSETGWVLEGTPLNDIGTSSFFANEQVEAEDLQTVKLQPGTSSLNAPTVTATAGMVFLKMKDPEHEFGVLADTTVGSDNLDREFVRLNTGDIYNTDVRALIGYSHSFAKNWNGPGNVNKHHLDLKLVRDWADGSSISVVTSGTWQVAYFLRNPTLAQFNALGDGFSYDRTFAPGDAAYYRLNVNPYKNFTTSVPVHLVANSHLSFDVTPYIWYGAGSGTFGSTAKVGSTFAGPTQVTLDPAPGQPTTPGASVVVAQASYDYQLRGGATAQATYELDSHHTFNVGYWLQAADQHAYTRVEQVNQTTGDPLNKWSTSGFFTYNGGRPYDSRDLGYKSVVNSLWIGDSMSFLDDALKIQAGFKYVWIGSTVDSRLNGAAPHQHAVFQHALPQLAASYQIDDQNQVYASASTTFKTPSALTVLANLYNRNTGLASQTAVPQTKPESAITEEVGYRYNGEDIVGSISGFHYDFRNRLLTLPIAFGNLAPTQSVNAGTQETYGIDAQIGTRPIIFNLRPYLTYEYLHARITSDLPVTSTLGGTLINDFLPTRGKTQISSPTNQFGVGLDYDDGTFFVNGQMKYVDSQFSTFMNDQSIPSYVSSKLGLGVRLPAIGPLAAPEIQLNLSNLGQTAALTGVNSFTTNAVGTVGRNGGTIGASQPSYYLLPHFAAALTISSSF